MFFHGKNGFVNARQCYVVGTLPVLLHNEYFCAEVFVSGLLTFSYKALHAFLISTVYATCPTYLVPLRLMILIPFEKILQQ